MEIIYKQDLLKRKSAIRNKINRGAVFIYPTDTIYGIGCNARSKKAVERIRKIKRRDTKPFSVIAPSKRWIIDNCDVKGALKWMNTLPAPYTFIFKLKRKAIVREVNGGMKTIGVRIPDHWFTRFVQTTGKPIVTTSVNASKEKHMTSLQDLDKKIIDGVDFIVYDGVHKGKPSSLINFTGEKPEIIHR